jgi:general secretion pathway protein F
VYVATVRAAERTGGLPRALSRYIAYQLQLESVRKRHISASIYPVMLLVAGGFVLLFLLGYVVPKFSVVYESAGRELPWMSAMLLGVGKIIYGHWVICATALAALVALAAYMATRSAARQRVLAQVLRVPLLARRVNEFRLARFYRAVSLLLAAGIPLTRALAMVGGLLNEQQQRALAVAREQVEAGQPLSVALVAHGLAAPVAESLIKIGESTGRLADMLERTAAFQDEDFSRWVDWTSRLLEPVLMMLIGLVIGAVVVLMYIPIFELAGGLQ